LVVLSVEPVSTGGILTKQAVLAATSTAFTELKANVVVTQLEADIRAGNAPIRWNATFLSINLAPDGCNPTDEVLMAVTRAPATFDLIKDNASTTFMVIVGILAVLLCVSGISFFVHKQYRKGKAAEAQKPTVDTPTTIIPPLPSLPRLAPPEVAVEPTPSAHVVDEEIVAAPSSNGDEPGSAISRAVAEVLQPVRVSHPSWQPVQPPTSDLYKEQNEAISEAWWERFKAKSSAAVSVASTVLPKNPHSDANMIGAQWDVEWAVNTDLEPLPSLPTFGEPEQSRTSTSRKPPSYSSSHRRNPNHRSLSTTPRASATPRAASNLATQMAVFESSTPRNHRTSSRQRSNTPQVDLESVEDGAPQYLFT
jgi:hypothetical protein